MVDAEQLAKIRQVYRLSCEEMGALIGVTGRFISFVERGERNLPKARADVLTEELDLTPEKIGRILAIYEETNIGKNMNRE